MKAMVATAIGPYQKVLKLQDVDTPECPAGELLVKVDRCGLAFPDVLTIEGKHIMKRKAPYIPGSEVSGTVVAVGTDVTGYSVGDRVFGAASSGGLAELATVHPFGCYSLPAGVDPAVAAGFELNYGTSWHGVVDVAKIKAGETLLVLGASGGVGMAAIDIGKAMGATVVACASTPAKLDACKQQGADMLIDYSDAAGFKKALQDAGVYGKVDVVYDPVGGAWAEPAMRSLAWGGRFLVVGFASGGVDAKSAIPKFPINLALLNEREILGVFWGAWKMKDMNRQNRANVDRMLELIRQRKLAPTVSLVVPLNDAMKAFDLMMNRGVIGKVCVDVPASAARL